MSEFIWTDETVKEFIRNLFDRQPHHFLPSAMESFKKSREQPIRDWEILEIEYCNERRTLIDGQYRIFSDGIGFELDYLLRKEDSVIMKVKRLSDGVVFGLGDEVGWDLDKLEGQSKEIFKIKSFEINDMYPEESRMFINDKNIGISFLRKVQPKPVLFTTEDGKEICNGDMAYYVEEDRNFNVVCHGSIANKNPHKYFSTSEAAKEYVLMNKKMFSINDVKDEIKKLCDGTYSEDTDNWTFVYPAVRIIKALKNRNV